MKIYLAADHRGYELKEKIKEWLSDWGYDCEDMGNEEFDPNDDYPDFVALAAKKVAMEPKESLGIVLGASGQGEAMAANRFKKVRAAVYYGGQKEIIKLSREHNDANVLAVGAAFVSDDLAKNMIRLWLDTKFSGAMRHKRRIDKIDSIN
ncbi:MAG: RpiB/LacA/LacB family sugar-phosphate isomerase [Candidatus Yanofskybacteria bacterium]|nr:RpiB/LacA/LacB family sugar-phosphate isomerase [Candidatus Yanofskybacteria bacterium]